MNLLNHWLMRLEKIEERMDGADPLHTWHLRMEKRILTFLTSLYREEAATIDLSEDRRPPAKEGPPIALIEKPMRPRTGAEISEILNRLALRENGESLLRRLGYHVALLRRLGFHATRPGVLFAVTLVLFDLVVLALIVYILCLAMR